jgi:hypothetical protein
VPKKSFANVAIFDAASNTFSNIQQMKTDYNTIPTTSFFVKIELVLKRYSQKLLHQLQKI